VTERAWPQQGAELGERAMVLRVDALGWAQGSPCSVGIAWMGIRLRALILELQDTWTPLKSVTKQS
jgi:hypothetical protein